MIIYANNIIFIILLCTLLFILYKKITRYSLKEQLLISVSHSHRYDTYLNEFLCFLIENKCFENYIYNIEKYNKINRNKKFHILTEFTNHQKKHDILANSFLWNNTQEGFNFWNKIDKKWRSYSFGNSHDIMILINYIKNLNIK